VNQGSTAEFSLLDGCMTPTFSQPAGSPFSAVIEARSMAVSDLNLDGNLDFAVVTFLSNDMTVMLSDGNGGFTYSTVEAGINNIFVAASDFNLDGKPDLAVLNNDVIGTVTILLGNGSGVSFTASTVMTGVVSPRSLAIGDFNLDSKPDLAVSNFATDGAVTILLGAGNGGFISAPSVGAGFLPNAMAVGDFNLDGKPDLAVVNEQSYVTILQGNGSGGFISSSVVVGISPVSIAVGDFNLDGKPDLVVGNEGSSNVSILLGNGSGDFVVSSVQIGDGARPISVAVGDFNLDGKPDVAVANFRFDEVKILLGNGSGGFSVSTFGAGDGPISVAVDDFNLDGRPDLAVLNVVSDDLTILLGACATNATPSITTTPVTLDAGGAAANSQIATVGDADQSPNTLAVKVNGSSSATVNGVTVSSLGINAAGEVTASVAASCAASNASFTLTVTDNQSATSSAQLNVNVTANSAPALGNYPASGPINIGAGATVTPSVAPSDNSSISSITAAAPGFTGTLAVNAAGVVSITNAGPAGNFSITVTATDNCGAQSSRSFSLTVVNNNCNVTVNPVTLAQPYVAVPYLQALSATPAGGYTFSVSAGALPPGLNLVTALGVTSIAGIPTTRGTYSFTIKAKRSNSVCEGARIFTVTIPATVAPILECVKRNANGSYTANFGYDNQTGATVTIPVGTKNYFTPGNQNRGQTTVFQPGRVRNAFSVTFSANGGNLAVWFLKGPDGVVRPVNVTTTSLGCP